jgi:hypothetical protein
MGIPNAGLAEMANLFKTAFTYVAVGDADDAFGGGKTTLYSEITTSGLGRQAATVTRTTTNETDDTTQLAYTWGAISSSETIREVAIFDASSNGNMGGRTVLTSPKDVVSGSTYTLTHKTIFARE